MDTRELSPDHRQAFRDLETGVRMDRRKVSIRRNQLIEQGIMSRLKIEHVKSGSELSFNEWILK